jgi:hypothetical protein
MAEQDQEELPWESSIDEDDEDLDAAVEDLPPGAVEVFNEVQRRHGFDPVVQTRAGRICWESELSSEEEAAGVTIRADLAAPPGREHEGPLD